MAPPTSKTGVNLGRSAYFFMNINPETLPGPEFHVIWLTTHVAKSLPNHVGLMAQFSAAMCQIESATVPSWAAAVIAFISKSLPWGNDCQSLPYSPSPVNRLETTNLIDNILLFLSVCSTPRGFILQSHPRDLGMPLHLRSSMYVDRRKASSLMIILKRHSFWSIKGDHNKCKLTVKLISSPLLHVDCAPGFSAMPVRLLNGTYSAKHLPHQNDILQPSQPNFQVLLQIIPWQDFWLQGQRISAEIDASTPYFREKKCSR